MKVLVDSSVWVAYLRGTDGGGELDVLIEEGRVATNDVILAELIPPLLARQERELVGLLREVECVPLSIGWEEVIQMQVTCLRNGINRVGIPDLLIAQNAIQNDLVLFSLDKHFALLGRHFALRVR